MLRVLRLHVRVGGVRWERGGGWGRQCVAVLMLGAAMPQVRFQYAGRSALQDLAGGCVKFGTACSAWLRAVHMLPCRGGVSRVGHRDTACIHSPAVISVASQSGSREFFGHAHMRIHAAHCTGNCNANTAAAPARPTRRGARGERDPGSDAAARTLPQRVPVAQRAAQHPYAAH